MRIVAQLLVFGAAVASKAGKDRIAIRRKNAVHRCAITSVLASASGKSANNSPICRPVLIHVSRLLRRRSCAFDIFAIGNAEHGVVRVKKIRLGKKGGIGGHQRYVVGIG